MSETSKAVFLSYASQDAPAVERIAEALRAAGIEVWFDKNELVGGDAWDAKIRGQIASCALFVPVISANTQARREGYFRLEWKLAAQRTHSMSDDTPFLLPVVIDETRDADAKVPPEFKAVQWTRIPPDGESLARFCPRVQNLLAGAAPEAVGGTSRPEVSGDSASISGQKAAGPKARRAALLAAGALAAAAVLVVALLQLWRQSENRTPQSSLAGLTTPTGPVSETQKLVAQARQVYEEGDELNRENLFLAEELVKRAVDRDPADPTAAEMAARLSYFMLWQQVDNSDARRDALRRQAARALALAPQSVAAQVIGLNARMAGGVWVSSGVTQQKELQEIEREVQALARREPANWQVQRSLGMVCRFLDRPDDSIAALRRAVQLSGGHPSAISDLANVLERRKRLDEFETVVASGLAAKPTGRLLAQDVFAKIRWRGDLGAARTSIESWPAWLLQEDRGLFIAWQAYFWSRQSDRALALVRLMPRDYLRDAWFAGPRAVLAARAHEISGHREAAETEWRAAIQVADRELGLKPEDASALYWKAWALARLGETARAQTLCTVLRQQTENARSSFFKGTNLAPLLLTVGLPEPALADVQTELTAFNDNNALTRAMLEFEPGYDAVRADPRFRQLVESAPAPQKKVAADGAGAETKSVAVLAFENRSSEKDSEYFSDGVSDELITVLGRVAGLKVVARTSSFAFKGNKAVSAPEIARALGVTHLVEGSVQQAGGKARVIARLIRADTGEQLWGDTFEPDVKDILSAQVTTARAIAQAMTLRLNAGSRMDSLNPAAVQLYLQGRQEWGKRTVEAMRRAEDLFTRAVAIEPKFARAHAGLVDTWITLGQNDDSTGLFGERESAEMRRIVERARLAVALDPESAEAHTSLGGALGEAWQPGEARRELERALELNPNYATAHHWLGRALLREGRAAEAVASLRRACELDPLSSRMADNLGSSLSLIGRGIDGLAELDRALVLQPDSQQAMSQRAMVLAGLGRRDAAVTQAREVLQSGGVRMMHAVYALSVAGQKDEAARAFESLPKTRSPGRHAAALAALDRWDECLVALQPAMMVTGTAEGMLFNAIFEPIRNDPRFGAMLETLGLREAHARAQAWRVANPPQTTEVNR